MKNTDDIEKTYQYILKQLQSFKQKRLSEKSFNNNKNLLQLIIESTSFLDVNAKLAERLYCIQNRIFEKKICPVCNVNPLKFSCSKRKYYETGCSPKCSKLNKTVQDKIKNTCLKKYGVESSNKDLNVKHKKEESFFKKYSVKNPSQVESIKQKKRNSCLKKFGVDCYLKTIQSRKARNIISLKESYYSFIMNDPYDSPCFTFEDFKSRYDEHQEFQFKCRKCGNVFSAWHHDGIHSHCPNCFKNGKSCLEHELCIFLQENNIKFKQHDRNIISPLELDFILFNDNIAIELDGLYWHCNDNVEKTYHLNKTIYCQENGIQLIHIFENEWVLKNDIVKNRLKNIFGIYDKTVFARKCQIKELTNIESRIFQNKNHLQGAVNSKVNIGLFYKDDLVSLMTFGKCRFDNKHEWEMLRFCNKLGYHIPGGASKLLKYFEKTYKPKSLVSYADRRWSQGKLYEKLGFKLDHISAPNYWYFKKLNMLSRIGFQKHKLKKILKVFDDKKTEVQNMKDNGYSQIFDCGNYVFEKIF